MLPGYPTHRGDRGRTRHTRQGKRIGPRADGEETVPSSLPAREEARWCLDHAGAKVQGGDRQPPGRRPRGGMNQRELLLATEDRPVQAYRVRALARCTAGLQPGAGGSMICFHRPPGRSESPAAVAISRMCGRRRGPGNRFPKLVPPIQHGGNVGVPGAAHASTA